jgi:transcriptional regulator with XRE-family HTH domain
VRPLEGVRDLRERRMLTQQELADRADVSLFTIQRIERGEGNVRPKTGRAIAGALGVGVEDLLGKAQAPLWLDEPPERRDIYTPWLEFVNGYADRWEHRIARGTIDQGALDEFVGTIDGLFPILSRLGLQEKREKLKETRDSSFGPIMGEAIGRLSSLFNPLIEAGVKQEEGSDLARLRRRREEMLDEQARAASG